MFVNNIYINRRRVLFEKSGLSKEEDFLNIIDGIEIKIDKYQHPDSVFFFKGDKYYFEQDLKNDGFYCSYDNVWSVFERQHSMNDFEIQAFIKHVVEKHFKMKAYTPSTVGEAIAYMVEKHFKMKAYTPMFFSLDRKIWVEKHFK